MRALRIILPVVCVAVLSPSPSSAAGWVQPYRRCYGKLWDRSLFGSNAYSHFGLRSLKEVSSFQDHVLSLYAECGVYPWITAVVALSPVGYARAGGKGTVYVGPLSAGLRLGLRRHGALRLALSARYGYAPPVGDEVLSEDRIGRGPGEGAGGAGEQEIATYQPALENHFVDTRAELGYGFDFGGWPAFISGSLGVRFNTASGVDHALVAGLQFGVTFIGKVVAELHANLYEPFFAAIDATNTAGIGQTRYLGLGLTASYWFVPWMAGFITADGVAYAESNAGAPSLAFGLETRFSL